MMDIALLGPAFVQVALTFLLLFAMGRSRVSSVRRGDVKVRDIALGQRAWPQQVQQISNSYHNQFELPVLFFALTAFVIQTRLADIVMVVLMWLFMVLRIGHAVVHCTSNNVPRRFNWFLASAGVLLGAWVYFGIKLAMKLSGGSL